MYLKRIINYSRFLGKFCNARFTGKRVPLIVILCVTNKCNLACSYCYGEHSKRNSWIDFTTDELLSMVRSLGKLGTSVLQIQGGEPLLRQDLYPVIKEAKRYRMICDIVTNGTLVHARKEVLSLFDRVCVSLDGPREVNDKNRGEGAFDRCINGIEEILRIGLPLRISSVLTLDTTTKDIDWLVNYSLKNKILLNFSPFFDFLPCNYADYFRLSKVNDESLRILFRHILKLKEEGALIQFSPKSYLAALNWPFSYSVRKITKENTGRLKLPKCYHGDFVFFIDADGSLYPCCNFWGRKTLNIKNEGLKEAILKLDREDCHGCYIPAYIDRNLFFEGNLGTWINYLMQGLRRNLL